jgi:hypothetical protein
MTNIENQMTRAAGFVIWVLAFLRHLDFGIRHS